MYIRRLTFLFILPRPAGLRSEQRTTVPDLSPARMLNHPDEIGSVFHQFYAQSIALTVATVDDTVVRISSSAVPLVVSSMVTCLAFPCFTALVIDSGRCGTDLSRSDRHATRAAWYISICRKCRTSPWNPREMLEG